MQNCAIHSVKALYFGEGRMYIICGAFHKKGFTYLEIFVDAIFPYSTIIFRQKGVPLSLAVSLIKRCQKIKNMLR